MELRRIDNYTYDVFTGNGWNNCSRVRRGRSSTFVQQGEKLPKHTLKYLHDVLHPTMPITYGQTVDQMLNNFNAIGA